MRIIGLLSIVLGLVVAFGYPYYHIAFTNFEIGSYTIYEKAGGFEEQTIWLAPEDAPIAIAFSAQADGVDIAGGSNTAIRVDIKNQESILRTENIRFSGPPNDTSASTTSSVEMNVDLDGFEINSSALYTFAFSGSDVIEIPLKSITMTITGIATAPSETVPLVGYLLIGLGALMYLVGGRRKSKKTGNAPSGTRSKTSQIGRRAEKPAPPAAKSKKPARKWGRDADS